VSEKRRCDGNCDAAQRADHQAGGLGVKRLDKLRPHALVTRVATEVAMEDVVQTFDRSTPSSRA
jgi:hypothetical protein